MDVALVAGGRLGAGFYDWGFAWEELPCSILTVGIDVGDGGIAVAEGICALVVIIDGEDNG